MKIDLYTRCWNDADMLGFMFRHYDHLVQRYIVFDDGSTDASLDILRANPKVDLRPMPAYSDPESRVASGLAVLENCWHESRGSADWVIVTDIDEHLWHRDLEGYLRRQKKDGVTIIPSLGFQMLSDDFPGDDCLLSEVVTAGAPFPAMNKMNIFSPDDIEATNFTVGRHDASPQGHVVSPARDELLLLHYKFLGFERTYLRLKQSLSRQRAKDLAFKWGIQYSWSTDELHQNWNAVMAHIVDTSAQDLQLSEMHAGAHWWDVHRHAGGASSMTRLRRWLRACWPLHSARS